MKNSFSNMSSRERALRVLQVFKDVGIDYSFGPGGIQFDGFYPSQKPQAHTFSLTVRNRQTPHDAYRAFHIDAPRASFRVDELTALIPLDAA